MKKLKEIEGLIKGKEGKTLEFKRDLSSFKPIMRTLIAFANTAGGTLVIGRDDSGKIMGVEDVLKAEESVANSVADSLNLNGQSSGLPSELFFIPILRRSRAKQRMSR